MSISKILLSSAALIVGATLVTAPVFAGNDSAAKADKDTAKWDVMNPPGKKRNVRIDVTEGTWMSLDVSPDGKTIAFDLLGDIYTMPASGGRATAIAKGMAWEIQPRFSPDGKRFIAARKHFTTSRSLGTGEMWLYHTSGGSGVQLTKKPSEAHQKEIGEPMFSPDGKYLYYSANTTPGPIFEYAQDSNKRLFEIMKYNMETGEVSGVVGGAGGAVRPTPSPDGKSIAFVKRVRAKSMLSGQIHRLDVADDNIEHIDFKVRDTRTVMDAPRPKKPVSPDIFETKMPRFVTVSPDGNKTVFESLGKLYVKSGDGTAKRLTELPDSLHELDPSFSRDGSALVFATWNDADLGAVHMMNVSTGRITTITEKPGQYRRPVISPDGEFITYEKDAGGYLTSDLYSSDAGLYVQAVDGSDPVRVSKSGRHPHFGADNLRIYFTTSKDKKNALVSTNLLGDQERTHASSKMAQMYAMSPTGKHVAFRENYNLYVMPVMPGPQDVDASRSSKALPVAKLSDGGATYPSWSGDGATINWTLGSTLFKTNAAKALANEDYEAPKTGLSLARKVKADRPEAVIALTGATIITMADKDGGVIENGTILIENGRIKSIGEDVRIPTGADEVELDGKTIIPGLIDAHAHGPQGADGLTPNQNWSAIGHLALGVTTIFDPSTSAENFFPAAEMQRSHAATSVNKSSKLRVIRTSLLSPKEARYFIWTYPWWRTATPQLSIICRSLCCMTMSFNSIARQMLPIRRRSP